MDLMREMTIGAVFLMEMLIFARCLLSMLGFGPDLALLLDAEIVSWETVLHLRKILYPDRCRHIACVLLAFRA